MSAAMDVLMKRDGLTRQEARETLEDVLTEIENGNYDALYEIGLEDDYIFDLV